MLKLSIFLCAFVFTIAGTASVLHSNGMPAHTNSPGETNCTQSSCHDEHFINSGTGSVAITWNGPSNWQYLPNFTYTINVNVAQNGQSLFGFDFEALTDSGANGGIISVIDTTSTQLWNVTILQNIRVNIIHKFNGGLTNNLHTFSFHWTAPASGNVTFYTSGLAANNDASTSGDYVYTASQTLTPFITSVTENTANGNTLQVFPTISKGTFCIQYYLKENYKNVYANCYALNGTYLNTLFIEPQTKGIQKKNVSLPLNTKPGLYLIKLFADNYFIGSRKIIIIE